MQSRLVGINRKLQEINQDLFFFKILSQLTLKYPTDSDLLNVWAVDV
jgi:hypothetical protein